MLNKSKQPTAAKCQTSRHLVVLSVPLTLNPVLCSNTRSNSGGGGSACPPRVQVAYTSATNTTAATPIRIRQTTTTADIRVKREVFQRTKNKPSVKCVRGCVLIFSFFSWISTRNLREQRSVYWQRVGLWLGLYGSQRLPRGDCPLPSRRCRWRPCHWPPLD